MFLTPGLFAKSAASDSVLSADEQLAKALKQTKPGCHIADTLANLYALRHESGETAFLCVTNYKFAFLTALERAAKEHRPFPFNLPSGSKLPTYIFVMNLNGEKIMAHTEARRRARRRAPRRRGRALTLPPPAGQALALHAVPADGRSFLGRRDDARHDGVLRGEL